ncbi:hypothetical protein EYF80_043190 [Liparis tanakae]|uniref:Uncharacterized protein n=1 Tax=Liparis tanakae TaxID=230148 RepID=A0A4Z2G121_9TELE|nr:hypothetical protein EYF80_043190 [Liparis tanakae]
MPKSGFDPVVAAAPRVRTPLSATSITPFSKGTQSLVLLLKCKPNLPVKTMSCNKMLQEKLQKKSSFGSRGLAESLVADSRGAALEML